MASAVGERLVTRCRPLLGTFVEITAPEGCEGAVTTAFAAIAQVHARMSFHDEGSDLARLRRAPAGTVVRVAAETVDVLRIAAALHIRSFGLFDVTVGACLVAAGFLPVPTDFDPAALGASATAIEICGDDAVRCWRPMLIDLGGIAKGYAVDRAIDTLAAAGVPLALVNAGGDVRALGQTGHVVHIRSRPGEIIAALELADAALATSSNTGSRRRLRGVTETPHRDADRGAIVSDRIVSILSDRCVIADAMTKVAMANPSLAARLLDELGGEMIVLPPLAVAA